MGRSIDDGTTGQQKLETIERANGMSFGKKYSEMNGEQTLEVERIYAELPPQRRVRAQNDAKVEAAQAAEISTLEKTLATVEAEVKPEVPATPGSTEPAAK